MIHQGHRYFSKLFLCFGVVLLIASLIPYAEAVKALPVKDKKAAKAVCQKNKKNYEDKNYELVIPVYQVNGNDVYWSCSYNKERPAKYTRNQPCRTQDFGGTKQEGPVPGIFYKCDNGKWQALLCKDATGKEPCTNLPPPPAPQKAG